MKKRLLSILFVCVVCVLCLGLHNPARAEGETELTDGDGTVYQLSRPLLGTDVTWHSSGETENTYVVPVGTVVTVLGVKSVHVESGGSSWDTPSNTVTITTERIKVHNLWFRVDPTSTDPIVFTDVPADAYYAESVQWAVEVGVTLGTGDGTTFSPNRECTRAEIVTMLWRLAGSPETDAANPYTDVPADSYYYSAALWAYEQGMVSSSTFSPQTICTRGMAAEFLWRQNKAPTVRETLENPFTDVSGDSLTHAVLWLVENGITTGTSDTTFSPEKACTRAQIVTFLYRMPDTNQTSAKMDPPSA